MSKYFLIVLILLSANTIAGLERIDLSKGNQRITRSIISFIATVPVTESMNSDAETGRFICKESGGAGCYSVSSIGEGICKAGGGTGCYSVRSIGEGICKAGGGTGCYTVRSIGEGFCKAGGGASCYAVRSIGEGICRGGGGISCYSVSSAGEGICKAGGGTGCYFVGTVEEGFASLPSYDKEWAWDQFYNEYGSLQWRCRGIQTGQFADNSNCGGKLKSDSRWPGK